MTDSIRFAKIDDDTGRAFLESKLRGVKVQLPMKKLSPALAAEIKEKMKPVRQAMQAAAKAERQAAKAARQAAKQQGGKVKLSKAEREAKQAERQAKKAERLAKKAAKAEKKGAKGKKTAGGVGQEKRKKNKAKLTDAELAKVSAENGLSDSEIQAEKEGDAAAGVAELKVDSTESETSGGEGTSDSEEEDGEEEN